MAVVLSFCFFLYVVVIFFAFEHRDQAVFSLSRLGVETSYHPDLVLNMYNGLFKRVSIPSESVS